MAKKKQPKNQSYWHMAIYAGLTFIYG